MYNSVESFWGNFAVIPPSKPLDGRSLQLPSLTLLLASVDMKLVSQVS